MGKQKYEALITAKNQQSHYTKKSQQPSNRKNNDRKQNFFKNWIHTLETSSARLQAYKSHHIHKTEEISLKFWFLD